MEIFRLWRFPVSSSQLRAFLGGDPAAGSPTATLLRLFPPHGTQIRRSHLWTTPHPDLAWMERRAVCARSGDVFTAR